MNKIEAVNLILEDLKKNYTTKGHNDLNIECAECMARILQAYLNWYKDLLEWGKKGQSTWTKKINITKKELKKDLTGWSKNAKN